MRVVRPADQPLRWRTVLLAVGASGFVHAVVVTATLFLPDRPSAASPRFVGPDAHFLDDEPAPWASRILADEPEAGEERSDVFRFADSEPEPRSESEPASAATLAGTASTPSSGTAQTTATGGGAVRGVSGGGNLFPAVGTARSVVYVIDCSLSMGLRGALETAKRELLARLEHLSPSTRFQVIFYNREAQPLKIGGSQELLPGTDEVRRATAALISDVRAGGSTDHLTALRQALLLRPEVIYLATDADDLTTAIVREVTRLNRERVVLHTLDLAAGRPEGDDALRDLAARNRGTYRAIRP